MAAYTTIDDAGIFFNSQLYTGTGSSLGVTGVGFQPDFTWIKNRDTTDYHVWTDAVRGATKYLICNDIADEATNAESLKSFDSDGFTVGTQNEVNTNTEDYVSWNWKAGTTTGIAGSPSITPTAYSFNQTCGFSVIAYTGNGSAGATVPHGLGVAPRMIILKRLDTTSDWMVYHHGMDLTAPEDYYGVLNTAAARVDSTIIWNDTAPTSTLFSIGTSTNVNGNTNTYIAYCFAPIQGYSKMGTYTGNGNADGTFVYTGFQPAYVMTKSQGGSAWRPYDNKRIGYNPKNYFLVADTTSAEGTGDVDLLSNGFKLRIASEPNNIQSMFYLAFANNPFVNSSGVPGTAR